jgi:hypothetical protein
MNENQWCFAWFINQNNLKGADRQGLANRKKWTSGDVITISFLDGDDSLKQKVKQFAREWVAPGMANLRFGFIEDTNDTMVRITFRARGNSSLIGKDCLRNTDPTLPTMGFNLQATSSDDEIRRRVLHEFGHVLGMIHEHQIPENGIEWNRDQVIADLSGNWSVDLIEENIFNVNSVSETNFTDFDRSSIMVYPLPANWTTNMGVIDWTRELSVKDKNFIRQQYP